MLIDYFSFYPNHFKDPQRYRKLIRGVLILVWFNNWIGCMYKERGKLEYRNQEKLEAERDDIYFLITQ